MIDDVSDVNICPIFWMVSMGPLTRSVCELKVAGSGRAM